MSPIALRKQLDAHTFSSDELGARLSAVHAAESAAAGATGSSPSGSVSSRGSSRGSGAAAVSEKRTRKASFDSSSEHSVGSDNEVLPSGRKPDPHFKDKRGRFYGGEGAALARWKQGAAAEDDDEDE